MTTRANARTLDKNALVEIYDQYNQKIFRYAYRLLGNAGLAEECVAETFSRLLQAVKNGGGPGENVQAYLYRIAHNWATDTYRGRPPEEALEPDMGDDPDNNNPSAILTRRLEQERVRQALHQLTREQRQVVVLRFFENWSHEEIATLIGKTAEATRALQHRALAALRSMLYEKEV